jgi:branched-chain amino acid transport system substrate-binding protein
LRAHQTGLVISFSSSYLPSEAYRQNDFRLLLAATNDRPTDAILLADQLPLAGNMLLDMQELGMKLPVLSGDSLDSSVTWNIAGKSAERLRFAGFVDPESKEPAYAAFRERYRRRFGSPPGYSGAQGYAALMLLAQAVERSRSTVPIVVGTTIRTNTWDGIFGKVSFGNDGQIEGRKVIIKHIENGHIVPVKEVNP